jgi:multisubunit Na+/H+ antiporter MnhB subunit
VAIAEAAIGGGLTSALLLAAARRVHGARLNEVPTKQPVPRRRRRAIAVVAAAVAAGAGWVVLWALPAATPGLGPRVDANLEASGVENPVTAVLLNFRAWDTLLEIAVLVLALIGVGRFRASVHDRQRNPSEESTLESIMLGGLVRLFLPAIVITGGYLLWRGADEPGGAFQAGAVLAGGGVIAVLAGLQRPRWFAGGAFRLFVVVGLAVFAAVGFGVMALGGAFLEYPEGWSKQLIILIESAATLSIACILVALFTAVLGTDGSGRADRGG